MHTAKQKLIEKIKESLASVLPITLIVFILCFTVAPVPSSALLAFLFGAFFLIIGMGLFTLGADMAMTPMGEYVGSYITKSKKLWLVIFGGLFIGIMITLAEPDLQVLASQVPAVPDQVLILSVAIGVGLFLMVALLRILFSISLSTLLVIFYIAVFVLSFFVPKDFLAIAFDSGGVTTGPMTVPFIMALGVGVASIRSDKHAENDSFGLVALCSIGPILAVLILGLVYRPGEGSYTPTVLPDISDSKELWQEFALHLPEYFQEVLFAIGPIVVFFIIFHFIALKLQKKELAKIGIGVLYTYLGLVLFLTGVNVGFMPLGSYLGTLIAQLPYNWILIPIAMIIGYFIVKAEPAVHVLNKQVEELTDGAISVKAMEASLSIGVSISLGLAMLRVLTGISVIWLLIPGYAIAIGLSFVTPKIFTSIAFDSGGVASGPMTATFVLPFAMGACEALGGNVLTDAFGVVAMVAMTPLITIQVLGLVYKWKQTKHAATSVVEETLLDEEIIDLDVEGD